jgi:4-carboxymuconolactone decarboxylase
MTPEQEAFYVAITKGKRSGLSGSSSVVGQDGSLLGPFGVLFREPVLGLAIQGVGEILRFSSPISDRLRESIVLMIAAHHGSGFEWRVHQDLARSAGLSDDDLSALRSGGVPKILNPAELKMFLFAQRLLAVKSGSADMAGTELSSESHSKELQRQSLEFGNLWP